MNTMDYLAALSVADRYRDALAAVAGEGDSRASKLAGDLLRMQDEDVFVAPVLAEINAMHAIYREAPDPADDDWFAAAWSLRHRRQKGDVVEVLDGRATLLRADGTRFLGDIL